MTRDEFENILDKATAQLNKDVLGTTQYHKPDDFEKRVFEVLKLVAQGEQIQISPSFHPHAFPDIKANGFGIEVKTVNKDNWLSVGNSIFEGMRDQDVKNVYIVFGKMGGMPAVKWGRYEERITHVRISHAPRFVIEMDRDSPLFSEPHIPISYEEFSQQSPEEKMKYVRQYSRNRLKTGERLWWLEDDNSQGRDINIRLYTNLTPEEKIKLRAQCAILFPQALGGSRVKNKYKEVAFFLLKCHNVIASQIRDLFSAGSVAGRARGGIYIQRALKNIESEIVQAAADLDLELFEEYWGEKVDRENILREWLKRADSHARDWKPSEHLFLKEEDNP